MPIEVEPIEPEELFALKEGELEEYLDEMERVHGPLFDRSLMMIREAVMELLLARDEMKALDHVIRTQYIAPGIPDQLPVKLQSLREKAIKRYHALRESLAVTAKQIQKSAPKNPDGPTARDPSFTS